MNLTKYDNILAQRVVNEEAGQDLKADGAIGPASREAIKKWQALKGLPANGTLNEATWAAMQGYIQERFVTTEDIAAAANQNGLPPSMLLAFWEIESVGAGFLSDKRCTILFEGHKFYAYVKSRFSQKQADEWARKYPDICYPVWTAAHYRSGKGEWARFEQARALDGTCAMLSTSWGLFQLMGFNYAYGGFDDVQTMVAEHMKSEHVHLAAIIGYINNYRIDTDLAVKLNVKSLRDAIIKRNYVASARIYNGSGYATHDYHGRLRVSDVKWSKVY